MAHEYQLITSLISKNTAKAEIKSRERYFEIMYPYANHFLTCENKFLLGGHSDNNNICLVTCTKYYVMVFHWSNAFSGITHLCCINSNDVATYSLQNEFYFFSLFFFLFPTEISRCCFFEP